MDIKNTSKSKLYLIIIIDIIMMILLIVNLSLIVFDWIFTVSFVNNFLQEHTAGFYDYYYREIHLNFHNIDLIFVAAFLIEFIFSWILAIVQKVYYKWFFYPFLHWYDLIGCIPVGSLRFLRILRVFSILIRLQNLKIIDLSKTYVYATLKKYYDVVVEEVSDRVVVNIIEGAQDEISEGGPVMDNIINNVLRPRQEVLVEWISRRLEYALERDVLIKKQEFDAYIKDLIADSLSKNTELNRIEQLPVMGKLITETIENVITNIVSNIIDKALSDLASYKNRELVRDTTEIIFNSIQFKDAETELNEIFKDISIDALEVVKKQVQIQKWKLKEAAAKGVDESEQKRIEFLMSDKS